MSGELVGWNKANTFILFIFYGEFIEALLTAG